MTETPQVLSTSSTSTALPLAATPSYWPTVTPFANEVTFKILGQIGGAADAVAVKDKVAYLGVGPQVLILDVSNPAMPQQIGQSGAFPDFVQDVAIVGNLVYVAAGNAGLYIMDLTKPLRPRQVSVTPGNGAFKQIIIQDNMAFIAETIGEYSNRQDVVRLFDISDSTAPHELNKMDGQLLGVQGNRVYTIEDKTLRVADISNPKMSLKVIDTGLKDASEIAGQYVYTVDVMNRVLGIVDLSDPNNPQLRGRLKLGEDFLGRFEGIIKINANLIYIKSTFWGESGFISSALFLVDVSDPDSPQQLGSWSGSEPSEFGGIFGAFAGEALEDNYLYLALGSTYSSNGLWIVDIHDSVNLRKMGSFSALTGVLNSVSIDNFAYTLRFGFPNDLEVVDLSNLDNIQTRETLTGVSSLDEMPLKDHYLYLPGSNGTILDLTTLTDLSGVNQNITGLENSSNIKIAGDHACVSNFNGGLSFVDISNPANPYLISHLDTQNIGYLACADTEAFYIVPSYNSPDKVNSLHIVNISDPAQPVEVYSQSLPTDYINDIAYGNGYLYVTAPQGYVPSYHEQLWVFDVSDKAHPRQVSIIEIGSHNSKISILGQYVYLAGDDVTVLDVSTPAFPKPIGRIEIPGGVIRISVLSQDTLLVTTYGGGVTILQIDGLK